MSDDYNGPCRTCGSPIVRVLGVPAERSLTDTSRAIIRKRICGNLSCPTNSRGIGA